MRVTLTTNSFEKQMMNVIDYSLGFLEGAEKGRKVFLDNLGKSTIYVLSNYIDIEAKSNPRALHHVYEWYQVGSPSARLFDINYTVGSLGLSLRSSFRQSRSLSEDATVPFYNKARIMEDGIPVLIKPKKTALRFNAGDGEVFTKKAITVRNPGGEEVQGGFERVFDEFIQRYFTQAFLKSSGLYDYLSTPKIYKANLAAGSKQGKAKGVSTGFKWITNAKVEVE